MPQRCIRCGEIWQTSALATVPAGGYVCPACAQRKVVKRLEKAKEATPV